MGNRGVSTLRDWVPPQEFNSGGADAWLREQAIPFTDRWYEGLGGAGLSLKDVFNTAAPCEKINLDLQTPATLFTHDFSAGVFRNRIEYGRGHLREALPFFGSRTHEGIHCAQFQSNAITHATLVNKNTRIILCPQDAVLLEELKERDASAKEWLIADMVKEDLLSEGSQSTREQREQKLHHLAGTYYNGVRNDKGARFVDYYRDYALASYERALDQADPKTRYIVIRLTPADVRKLGDSAGFSTFGTEADAARWLHPTFTERQQERIAWLDAKMEVGDRASLLTLSQALSLTGQTEADFLAAGLRSEPLPASVPEKPDLNLRHLIPA